MWSGASSIDPSAFNGLVDPSGPTTETVSLTPAPAAVTALFSRVYVIGVDSPFTRTEADPASADGAFGAGIVEVVVDGASTVVVVTDTVVGTTGTGVVAELAAVVWLLPATVVVGAAALFVVPDGALATVVAEATVVEGATVEVVVVVGGAAEVEKFSVVVDEIPAYGFPAASSNAPASTSTW